MNVHAVLHSLVARVDIDIQSGADVKGNEGILAHR